MSEWISVKDRFPELDQIVLAWLEILEEPVCLKFSKDATGAFWQMLYFPHDPYRHFYRVTHWMPLPQPPEQE